MVTIVRPKQVVYWPNFMTRRRRRRIREEAIPLLRINLLRDEEALGRLLDSLPGPVILRQVSKF
jgi:hypothetical protein